MNSKPGGAMPRETRRGEQGFSILQLVITIAIMAVVTAMAVMGISRAQQDMKRENTIREFKAYLEKARLDSIRRHATDTTDQASVSIIDSNTYQVAFDINYDGALAADEVRTIIIPSDRGVQFSTGTVTLPMTTRFDWRGRATTVQANGTAVSSNFTIANTTGSYTTTLNLTAMGDASVGTAATVSAPSRTTVTNTTDVKTDTKTANTYSF